MIPIDEVVRQYGVAKHQLHDWEKKEYLYDVWQNPEEKNKRYYTEEHIERILFIKQVLDEAHEKGKKRVEQFEMKQRLLEKFGGEVVRIHRPEAHEASEMMQLLANNVLKQLESLTTANDEQAKAVIEIKEVVHQLVSNDERREEVLLKALREEQEKNDATLQLVKTLEDKFTMMMNAHQRALEENRELKQQLEPQKKHSKWKFWAN